MLKLLQRFLATQFILPFMVIVLFCVGFMISFQMIKVASVIFSGVIETNLALQLIFEMMLSFLTLAVPLSILLTSLFCFSRLSKDSEYIAMRSIGMSRLQVMLPFLLLSALVGLALYQLSQTTIPLAQRHFKASLGKIQAESVLKSLKQGQFFTQIPKVTFFAEKIESTSGALENIFINRREDSYHQSVMAKSGKLIQTPDSISLELFEGNQVTENLKNKRFEKIHFEEYKLPVLEKSSVGRFIPKGGELTGNEIKEILFTDSHLRSLYNEDNLEKIRFEYWGRYNIPILCILFAFLGFCLGITPQRGKNKKSFWLVFTLGAYYSLYFGLVSMGRKGQIDMSLAVFLPSLILLVWNLYLMHRFKWHS